MNNMEIEMIPVEKSSNVQAYGYKANVIRFDGCNPTNVLRVSFLNGLIYDYLGVSEEIYKQFLGAESKGSFLHRNIYGKYQTIKVQ